MTSLFRQRKPRGYHHQMIYSDERRERLKAMEEQARLELGMSKPSEVKPEDFRGAFSQSSSQRRRNNSASLLGSMPTAIMIVLIAALLLLLPYLAE